MTDAVIQTSDLKRGASLRAVFSRRGDRFRHTVELVDEPHAPLLLAVSEEGSGNVPWPPSPPLQQLSLEQIPTQPAVMPPDGTTPDMMPSRGEASGAPREVAFLVGMAGGHWSMSVDSSGAALVFDVACRLEPPSAEWLGSTYQLSLPWRMVDDLRAEVRRGGRVVRLRLLPIPEQPPVGLTANDERLRVSLGARKIASRATLRWKYRFELK